MKKNPVTNIQTPSYPTMAQLRGNAVKFPISKVAAVTAITTAMTLASGCVEQQSHHRLNGRLEDGAEKARVKGIVVDIQGEIGYTDYIEGLETCYTEPTEVDFMGDVEVVTEPTDDEWDLMGEDTCYTEETTSVSETTEYILSGAAEIQTEPTDDEWDLMGEATPFTDDMAPSET